MTSEVRTLWVCDRCREHDRTSPGERVHRWSRVEWQLQRPDRCLVKDLCAKCTGALHDFMREKDETP